MLSKKTPKLSWFETPDGTIHLGSRKDTKGDDRQIWVNMWDGKWFNTTVVQVPLNKTPWDSLDALKEALLKKLQWQLGALRFRKIKTFAASKNPNPGWCCFTVHEGLEEYFNGASFQKFDPETMEMSGGGDASVTHLATETATKRYVIENGETKEPILEKGNWIVVDENTEYFAKSPVELKNFVDWVSSGPPKKRVENVYYGPYWPFVAFYYQCTWVPVQKVYAFMKQKGLLVSLSDKAK
jgi:hypothetical protein